MGEMLDKIGGMWFKKKMKRRDRDLLVESVVITVIYLLSFGVLSLGRVQQKFFWISEVTFSSIQIMSLTFIFAVIITFVIYSLYKSVIK